MTSSKGKYVCLLPCEIFVDKFNHRSYSTALCRQPFCDLSKASCWTYWSPWSISLTVPIFLISISTHEIHSRAAAAAAAVFYARKTVVCVSIAQHRVRPTKVTVSAKLLATQKLGTKTKTRPTVYSEFRELLALLIIIIMVPMRARDSFTTVQQPSEWGWDELI